MGQQVTREAIDAYQAGLVKSTVYNGAGQRVDLTIDTSHSAPMRVVEANGVEIIIPAATKGEVAAEHSK